MRQKNIIIFPILCAIFLGSFGGCENRSPKALRLDVEGTLQEPDWPVYRARCLVLQVPDKFEVHAASFVEHFGLSVVEAGDEERTLVTFVNSRFDADTPCNLAVDEAVLTDVGGMESYLIEEKKNGIYSGEICIDAREFLFTEVRGSYDGLSQEERDLVMRIVRSFRIHLDRRSAKPEELPSGSGETMRISPISDPDLAQPVTVMKPNQICP